MSRLTRIAAAATLEELYALIPQPDGCDGSCSESCGPIAFSAEEGRRLIAATGVTVPNAAVTLPELGGALTCPLLDIHDQCSAYDHRPALCRIWGVTVPAARMRCMAPTCSTRHPLSEAEANAVMARSMELGGNPREIHVR